MPKPTIAELFRLDALLARVGIMPEMRWRRLWAAYHIKFGWPFSTGEKWLWDEEAVVAWRQWAGMAQEEEYSL